MAHLTLVRGGDRNTNGTIVKAAYDLQNNKSATVYTVGLSVDNVDGAEAGLRSSASDRSYKTFFKAEDGTGVVTAVESMINSMMVYANLYGDVTDTIDTAFYPVDKEGNPLVSGQEYEDEDGHKYTVTNNNGTWTVSWQNQSFAWPERDESDNITEPGWKGKIYVKAKEDFLGGNRIPTNKAPAHVTASKYQVSSSSTPKDLGTTVTQDFISPAVNVDELHLTEHSTEWTVYLGTEVKPEDQLKALWDEIKVKQVVKPGGTANDGTTITGSDKKYYAKTDTNDIAAPATGKNQYSELTISRYFTDADFNALLNQLKTSNTAEKTITYPGYDHNPGTITVKLEKTIVEGAKDAAGKAPGQHTTDKDASPAETYKISVTYNPQTDDTAEIGHITTGSGVDEVKSENEHKINVIKKGLEIEKRDKDTGDLIPASATFKLYRPAATGENGETVTGLTGSFYEVATLTTDGGRATLNSALPELRKLPNGQHYYLVETSEPSGYIQLTSPVQVDVAVTEGAQTKPYEASEGITTLVNKGTPTADIMLTSSDAEKSEGTEQSFVIKIKNEASTVDITIHKVNDKNAPLAGATFKLMHGPEVVTVASSGMGVVVEPKVSGQTVTIEDNTFTIPEGGVTIKNLKASDTAYEIVEVSPPAGYVLTNSTPATFKVTAGQVTDEHHIEGVNYSTTGKAFTIPNEPGVALPNTGGPGTRIFTIPGSILILGAGVLLWRRRNCMKQRAVENRR